MFNTKEKKERSLGVRLFLKADRCSGAKCAVVRNPFRPGAHGKDRRRALSEVGQQLQEKQKVQYSYGIRETYLRKVFEVASKNPGVTGEMIISTLERRLDNVVYRFGFTPSRSVARQLVGHGHFLVNGKRVNIPSYLVKPGDIIKIRPQSKEHIVFKDLEANFKKSEAPIWLTRDNEKIEGKVSSQPKDYDISFDINMIVDYYSK